MRTLDQALHGTPHVPVLPVTIPNGANYLLSRQTNELGNYASDEANDDRPEYAHVDFFPIALAIMRWADGVTARVLVLPCTQREQARD